MFEPNWHVYYISRDGSAIHEDDYMDGVHRTALETKCSVEFVLAHDAEFKRVELIGGPKLDADNQTYSAMARDHKDNFYRVEWDVVPAVGGRDATVGKWTEIK